MHAMHVNFDVWLALKVDMCDFFFIPYQVCRMHALSAYQPTTVLVRIIDSHIGHLACLSCAENYRTCLHLDARTFIWTFAIYHN